MDVSRPDPTVPFTFDVDLADTPTTGHVTELCLYTVGETPHMMDTITVNGHDLTAPAQRMDTMGDGRYTVSGSDDNSIGLTCYPFTAWFPGAFSNGTNTITVTGQRAIVYAAFVRTMPGPWIVPV
jgi:hypothetical protein